MLNEKDFSIAHGQPANVPAPQRSLDDIIVPIRPTRPASTRAAVPGINVPAEGETWQELAAWRAAYGLSSVTDPAA